MKITDRPGRYFALFIVGPFLLYVGFKIYKYKELKYESIFLIILGILFICYETYWISFKNDETLL